MRWEDSLLALFDDLEQQAGGLHLAERDAEVAALSQAEYAAVSWASRLGASLGATLTVRLLDGRPVGGRLERVGTDWLLLEDGARRPVVVRCAAVASVTGASERSVADEARSVLMRLPLRSVLRGLADRREEVILWLADGAAMTGHLGRVGQDFVELVAGADRTVSLVRFEAVSLVRSGG